MEKMKRIVRTLGALALGAAIFSPAPAAADEAPLTLEVNQAVYQNVYGLTRVYVTNPDIADVRAISPSELSISGLSPGSTTISVWTQDGMRQDWRVTVMPADDGLAQTIQREIGLPGVVVRVAGAGESRKIMVSGIVRNQSERILALKIAELYAGQGTGAAGTSSAEGVAAGGMTDTRNKRQIFSSGTSVPVTIDDTESLSGNVIDLLQMESPEQINIEAEIIEIDSSDADQLGATFHSRAPGADEQTLTDAGTFYIGESVAGVPRETGGHWYDSNWLFTHFSQFNIRLHALIQKGKARVITRPNITTLSGKTAGIHIGGKILVPSTNTNGATSYDEKDYGIELDLVRPTVDENGNVTATLYTSVSTLDRSNGILVDGNTIPGITDRTATSVVHIPSGMTMGIGGLLNSEESDTVQKFPLLGDIPLLGNLFKYHDKTNRKSELVILLTPRVVSADTPARMSEQMKETYEAAARAAASRVTVDLNQPPAAEEDQEAETPAAAAEEPDATLSALLKQRAKDESRRAADDAVAK